MIVRNSIIDVWADLADSPEVIRRMDSVCPCPLPAMQSDAHKREMSLDRRRRWIDAVFWQKALPSPSDWTPFPKVGIYELLAERGRVRDFQGTALTKEFLSQFRIGVVCCAEVIADRVEARLSAFGFSHARVTTHPYIDLVFESHLRLSNGFKPWNILFCLHWPSIQISSEILIPDPSEHAIFEDFSI